MTSSLHPILAALVAELERDRALVLAAADRVPPACRDAPPPQGGWSAAQVLSHLAAVEASSGKLFSVHARRLRDAGAPAETATDATPIIDGFARFRVHERTRLVEAPELVLPADGITFEGAREAMAASRARLLEAIDKASGLALGTVSAPHPRLGPLTLYEWLLMIARHEVRHAGQLDDLATA
jgi:uncharacterized damage-inducible protein DinB